jgi:hypothetical protein
LSKDLWDGVAAGFEISEVKGSVSSKDIMREIDGKIINSEEYDVIADRNPAYSYTYNERNQFRSKVLSKIPEYKQLVK